MWLRKDQKRFVTYRTFDLTKKEQASNFKQRNLPARNISFIPGHMDNPIVETEPCMLVDPAYTEPQCLHHKALKRLINKMNVTKTAFQCCGNPWACLRIYFEHFKETQYINPATTITKLKECIIVAVENYKLQKHHFNKTIDFNIDSRMTECINSLLNEYVIKNAFKHKILIKSAFVDIYVISL